MGQTTSECVYVGGGGGGGVGAGSINNNKNLQLTPWIGLLKTPARQMIEMRHSR